MDDLDHSMHIAEYDWTSFFEESEECGLLKPSFAYPDNLSLSDSEDSGNSSSVSTGQKGRQQQSLSANTEEADSNAAGRIEGVQISQRALGGESVDLEICLCYPEINNINITEETNDETAIRPQTEQLNVQSLEAESTEIKKEERDVQTERDTCKLKSIQGPDPLACNQPENNANEQHTTQRAVSEDVSSVAEKERWFVTINENPARQRVRAPPLKKKRRQKKNRKDNHMCRTPCQEKSLETGSELEIVKDNRESEGGRDTLAGYSSAEENPVSDQVRVISDLSHMSSEEDNLSEKQVMSHHNTENIIEPMRDSNTHEPSSLAATLFDSFVPADPSRLDRVESEEFFSTYYDTCYDSESYLSATESVEEPQHLLIENRQPQCSSPLTDSFLFNPTENTHADETQDRELPSCESTLSCNVRAANCEGYQSTEVEPIQTFQPAGQSANKMPDDDFECDKDSTLPRMPTDTPGPQTRERNLSVSGCSSGSQPSLLPVPDLTVTPCSVADTPETYAKAEGDPRPVYAISAFWDEMEKLTINDILRLRMGRSPSPRDTQETVTPDLAESPRNQSPLGDTVEYSLSDGVLMDTSDTADSDYFTQPDESKPGRSSCEFSTSDFEEEYWQFLGSSRNPSPDPQRKNHKGTSESPHFEEEGSASSEGKMTPVPTEDFTRQCFEYLDSNDITSSKHAWPRPMPKNKSLFNVQALNTEDVSLQLLLGNDESSLFLSNGPSLEENVFLKASDSLGTPICAPFLPNTHLLDAYDQISVSDVVEYFSPEDKAKGDSLSVTVYDPDNISVAPLFDYTLCTFRDETPFFSLYDFQCTERKPIPIFSCSHPTVREITFPNPDFAFLSADWKVQEDISPIAAVSRAFFQGSDCGTFEVALQGFCGWKSFLPMRKIRFHDKGSIWCGRAGTWVFPVDADKIIIKRADPPISVFTEKGVVSTPSTLLRDLAVQQVVLEAIQTRREGIFSTLKQSDMCLVCIAFASWVLRSSDPEAADTWKAALLANVSALSAIQYLRQYVRKKNPSQDHP